MEPMSYGDPIELINLLRYFRNSPKNPEIICNLGILEGSARFVFTLYAMANYKIVHNRKVGIERSNVKKVLVRREIELFSFKNFTS